MIWHIANSAFDVIGLYATMAAYLNSALCMNLKK